MSKTPLVKIDNLYLKREDLNLTGSAKDRAIIFQVENLKKQGFNQAVISSTGNAAISAAYFCQKEKINLTIFLSPEVNLHKLEIIKKYSPEIIFSKTAISDAIKFSKTNQAYLLRQSTDLTALDGYQQIGKEMLDQLPQITSIFVPVGSGTTLLGISQSLPSSVKIFAAQPAANCPISKFFDSKFTPESENITDAITVKAVPLKDDIIKTIKNSQGNAFTLQNQEIIDASNELKLNKIETSLEGALALAAFYKAKNQKIDFGNYPVIILTGCQR